MQLPFFYIDSIRAVGDSLTLNEETSKHIVSVLRMKAGEELHLTDGKGNLIKAEVLYNNKKHCEVLIKSAKFEFRKSHQVTIAHSLLKNASRFEWFLEKATEIGVSEIIPLLCERTERLHFRKDRMVGLLVSAMLQSRQCWLPQLKEPLKFDNYIELDFPDYDLFIGYCDDHKKPALSRELKKFQHSLVCIGPEGDFTKNEIEKSLERSYIPVSLGNSRLRSETAGVVAATLLCIDT